jgi:catalase
VTLISSPIRTTGFPAKNPEEFQQFFLAIAGSKPRVPSPTPIEAFQETHPAAKAFLTTRDPPPVSYATTTYFGVNSFKFVNEKGAVTIGRYQLRPDAGRHFLSKDESAKAATNYLEEEIRQRVAREAVLFKVVLQLAAPGDKIDDPSVAWAATNKITALGTLPSLRWCRTARRPNARSCSCRRSCLPASNPRTR